MRNQDSGPRTLLLLPSAKHAGLFELHELNAPANVAVASHKGTRGPIIEAVEKRAPWGSKSKAKKKANMKNAKKEQ